jgi:hypothetical protein
MNVVKTKYGNFHRALTPELVLRTDKILVVNRLIRNFPNHTFHTDGKVSDLTLSMMELPKLKEVFPKSFNKNKKLKELMALYNKKYKKFAVPVIKGVVSLDKVYKKKMSEPKKYGRNPFKSKNK